MIPTGTQPCPMLASRRLRLCVMVVLLRRSTPLPTGFDERARALLCDAMRSAHQEIYRMADEVVEAGRIIGQEARRLAAINLNMKAKR